MVAEVTASQLWFNRSLMALFFRTQAENTLNELMNRIPFDDREMALETIEDHFSDLNECEETFYSESVEDILKMLDLTEIEEEDDKDF